MAPGRLLQICLPLCVSLTRATFNVQYEPISCMNVKTKIFARICTTARFTHLWRDPQTRVTAADQQHVFVIALLE